MVNSGKNAATVTAVENNMALSTCSALGTPLEEVDDYTTCGDIHQTRTHAEILTLKRELWAKISLMPKRRLVERLVEVEASIAIHAAEQAESVFLAIINTCYRCTFFACDVL